MCNLNNKSCKSENYKHNTKTVKVKVNAEFTLEQVTTVQRGNRGRGLLVFFNPGRFTPGNYLVPIV
jgi:hypothetical protein